jgi:hypothetical protein
MAPRPVLEAAAESLEELPLDGAPVLSSPTYQTNVCAFASADGVAAPLVDSAFARLFTGIALTRAQQSDACGVLIDLERQQRAANESAREELRRNAVPAGAVITRRNDALRALLGDEAARALLAARTSPGPRSAGSAPASGARSGAANPEVQGRIGGAPQSAPANTSASVAEQSGAAIFERLFEGIALTREQAESARAIIIRAEEELAPFRPVAPAILRFTRGTRIVSIRAPAGAELSALLSSDADRALLESRMSVAPR